MIRFEVIKKDSEHWYAFANGRLLGEIYESRIVRDSACFHAEDEFKAALGHVRGGSLWDISVKLCEALGAYWVHDGGEYGRPITIQLDLSGQDVGFVVRCPLTVESEHCSPSDTIDIWLKDNPSHRVSRKNIYHATKFEDYAQACEYAAKVNGQVALYRTERSEFDKARGIKR